MVAFNIISEMDSRVTLYPLMRCLLSLGDTLVITRNPLVKRLIDNDVEGTFRNFHIIVDDSGASDELVSDYGINIDDYVYVIYDNSSVIDTSAYTLVPIGPYVSEEFYDELERLNDEDGTLLILRYGQPVKSKHAKAKTLDQLDEEATMEEEVEPNQKHKKSKSKFKKPELSPEELELAAVNKFKPVKETVDSKLKKVPSLKFPTYEEFELLESSKMFSMVDKNLMKILYTMLKPFIGLNEGSFMKEVSRRDEGSSSFDKRRTDG